MASISELRNRSKTAKELQEQKMKRIKETVVDVVNSSAFTLSALNHIDSKEDDDDRVQAFATEVANKVAEVVVDAKAEFLDVCTHRGLKPSQIRKAVELLNEVYGFTTSNDYEEKLQAVASYVRLARKPPPVLRKQEKEKGVSVWNLL